MKKISREFVEKGGPALRAVLLGVVLLASHPAPMATAEPRMSVVYNAPLVSIEASGMTVAEVLREVGRKVGFSIAAAGSSDARLSFSIHDASLPEALQQLLRSENHVLLYRDGTPTIDTVMLLGARVAGASVHLNQSDQPLRHLENQDQGGMNAPAGIVPTSATPISGSPEALSVTDQLLRHAGSGVAASPMTPASGGGPVASSAAISTDAGAADPGSTLAITTRVAQQNLKKLVEALSAATSSMLSSQRR